EFPQSVKVREFMKKGSDRNLAEFYDGIPAKDRMKAFELMAMQVGPSTGYDTQKMMLDAFLRKWAEKDFEEVWSSATLCDNDGLRRYMVNQLLESLARTEPDKAMDLYLERIDAGDEVSASVPLWILTKRSGESADAFLDTFLKMPSSPMGATTTDMTFSENFDFGRVAEALAELKRKDKEYRPAAFAGNFLQKWAEQDIDAAHGWWLANGDVSHSGWSGFIDGIERKSGPAEAAQWAATQIQEGGKMRQKMIESISNAQTELLIGRITPIADAMPDTGSKDRFYIDVMKFNQYGDLLERYDFALNKMSSPEARLQAFEEIGSEKYTDLSKTTDSQFQAWGITREQAAAALKRGSKR
ncbi:MAG TPA: hypothetical protein VM511_02095, partial [Luteolibacter sp.]|nr:hypothetical protein [Luteolibacter sp.]